MLLRELSAEVIVHTTYYATLNITLPFMYYPIEQKKKAKKLEKILVSSTSWL